MGFGPRAAAWITSTMTSQTARLMINGWMGQAIDIRSGVRQGDPAAPTIFALLLEPLACMLRHRLPPANPPPLHERKVLLFADDLSIRCRTWSEVDEATVCLRQYEKAAASKLNYQKSLLYPLGSCRTDAPTRYHEWRVQTVSFDFLGVPCGRTVNGPAHWREIIGKLKARLARIPLHDLPLLARCNVINQYIYSKVIYLDRFLPCPDDILEDLEATAYTSLYRSKHHDVSRERLETPRDLGGFGFTPLRFRLIKARAQWAGDVLFRPELPASIHIRKRIIHTMSLDPEAYRMLTRTIFRDGEFIRGPRPANFSWLGVFLSPVEGQWFFPAVWWNAIPRLRRALPARWQAYLRAWFEEISFDMSYWNQDRWRNAVHWMSTFGTDSQLRLGFLPIHTNLGRLNAPHEPHGAHSRTLANRGLIIPKGWQDHFPALTKIDWKRQWCLLKAVSRASPEDVDLAHRFSLYSLHPGKHTAAPFLADGTATPHNRSKRCALCLTAPVESFFHLFDEPCPVVRAIWSAAAARASPSLPSHPPSLQTLVCPTPSPPRAVFLFHCIFVARTWRFVRRRRYRKIAALDPVTDEEISKIASTIRRTHWQSSTRWIARRDQMDGTAVGADIDPG